MSAAASSATSTKTSHFIRELSDPEKLRLLGIVAHCWGEGIDNIRERNEGAESDRYFSPKDASFLDGLFGTAHYVQMGQLNSSEQLTTEKLGELGRKFFIGDAPYQDHQDSRAYQEGFHALRAKALLALCGDAYSKRIAALENLVSVKVDDKDLSIAKEHTDLFEYDESYGFNATNVTLKDVPCVPAYNMKWAGQRYITMRFPDPERLGIFAQLVDELDVGVIVRLSNSGGSYIEGENGTGNLGKYKWTIESVDQEANDRNIEVNKISTSRGDGPKKTVYQIVVDNWDDTYPPEDPVRASIVKSLQLADLILLKRFDKPRSILVQCRAGVRRTGRWTMAHALFRSWQKEGNKGIEDPVAVAGYFRSPQTGALPIFGGVENGFGIAFQMAALAIEEHQKTGKTESKQEHKQENKQQETTSGSTSAATGTTTTSSATSNGGKQESKAS